LREPAIASRRNLTQAVAIRAIGMLAPFVLPSAQCEKPLSLVLRRFATLVPVASRPVAPVSKEVWHLERLPVEA
jgi:hypothetical protein